MHKHKMSSSSSIKIKIHPQNTNFDLIAIYIDPNNHALSANVKCVFLLCIFFAYSAQKLVWHDCDLWCQINWKYTIKVIDNSRLTPFILHMISKDRTETYRFISLRQCQECVGYKHTIAVHLKIRAIAVNIAKVTSKRSWLGIDDRSTPIAAAWFRLFFLLLLLKYSNQVGLIAPILYTYYK